MKRTIRALHVTASFIALASSMDAAVQLSNIEETASTNHVYAIGGSVNRPEKAIGLSFFTGDHEGGYKLDAVKLKMRTSLSPARDFKLTLNTADPDNNYQPGEMLNALEGETFPASEGIYTYTPSSYIRLEPLTGYFIIASAKTNPEISNTGQFNSFDWLSTTANLPAKEGDWFFGLGFQRELTDPEASWKLTTDIDGVQQFGLTQFEATAVPEQENFAIALAILAAAATWLRRWWSMKSGGAAFDILPQVEAQSQFARRAADAGDRPHLHG